MSEEKMSEEKMSEEKMSEENNNVKRNADNKQDEPDDFIPVENQGLAQEFIDFIRYNKAWWMTPIILVLAFMVGFILLAESSPILPFIYTVI
jgi:hypothetical protein